MEYIAYRDHAFDWAEAAGTVYGGVLDATTGVLTVDRVAVDLGTLEWKIYASSLSPYFWAAASTLGVKYVGPFSTTIYPVLCTNYKTVKRTTDTFVDGSICLDGNAERVTQIQIKDLAYADADAFAAAMSGVKLVYELAEPLVYRLTPEEMIAAAGENGVGSDMNGDVTVRYMKRG